MCHQSSESGQRTHCWAPSPVCATEASGTTATVDGKVRSNAHAEDFYHSQTNQRAPMQSYDTDVT